MKRSPPTRRLASAQRCCSRAGIRRRWSRGSRIGRQRAVAASAAAYCIAVAVNKPMHVDAHAARVAMSPGEAKQPRSREYEVLCSPRNRRASSKGTHGAAAHRSDSASTRPPQRCPAKGNKVDASRGMLGHCAKRRRRRASAGSPALLESDRRSDAIALVGATAVLRREKPVLAAFELTPTAGWTRRGAAWTSTPGYGILVAMRQPTPAYDLAS
jgi:hypothetical protein